MAIWIKRSTNMSHHYLKKRISFWENPSHSFHTNIYLPTYSIGENCRNPTPFFCESKALFSSRRFESIKTSRDEDLQQDINGDHQNQECFGHHWSRKMGLMRLVNKQHLRNSLSTTLPPISCVSPSIFSFHRFESTKVQEQELYSIHNDHPNENIQQGQDFPGGRIRFTSAMNFNSEFPMKRIPCYRVLDDNGHPIMHSGFRQVSKDDALKMYSSMVTLQTMDNIFYEAQRQGRISFYVTSYGEEAINIASAAALTQDDIVLPQYREHGVLLWRGFTLQEFANQCFGNKADYGKGRQMPIHYGSSALNYFNVSSPIATQLPQAVGAAYSLKMDRKNACAVTYFGDGGSSEGDFHAGLNFAAVMEAPVIFICRNNGWAISTPISEQFRSDGVVVKGQAYGIPSIRVDGNDALAVYCATRAAREMSINEQKPILLEAITYRVGHHSTSDDSTKYRPADEIEHWKTARNPIARFRKWVNRNGWWSDEDESKLRANVRQQLMDAIQVAEKTEKPPISDLFADVYEKLPSNLREQEQLLRETVKRYPQDYPSDVPV